MSDVLVIFRRELRSYFATPLAYVFIVIFLVLAAVFTFQVGGFFERGQADLQPFFRWHPWLYLVLIPAISMRLWAEERNSGSIELLMTLPITLWQAVVGKFLAAWCFAGIALLPEVAEVESDARELRLTAVPKRGANTLAAVSAVIEKNNWEVPELHLEPGRLDEVFRSLTQSPGTAQVPAAQGAGA